MGAFADALVNSGMRQAQALVIERGMGGVPPIPGTLEFKEALIRVGVDHHSATLLSNGLLSASVPEDGNVHVVAGSQSAAEENRAAIQAAINAGRAIIGPVGVVYLSSRLVVGSGQTLRTHGSVLKMVDFAQSAVLINRAATEPAVPVTVAWASGKTASLAFSAGALALTEGGAVVLQGDATTVDRRWFDVARVTGVTATGATVQLSWAPTVTPLGSFTARRCDVDIDVDVEVDYNRSGGNGTAVGQSFNAMAVVMAFMADSEVRVRSSGDTQKYGLLTCGTLDCRVSSYSDAPAHSDTLKIYGPSRGMRANAAGYAPTEDCATVQPYEPDAFLAYQPAIGGVHACTLGVTGETGTGSGPFVLYGDADFGVSSLLLDSPRLKSNGVAPALTLKPGRGTPAAPISRDVTVRGGSLDAGTRHVAVVDRYQCDALTFDGVRFSAPGAAVSQRALLVSANSRIRCLTLRGCTFDFGTWPATTDQGIEIAGSVDTLVVDSCVVSAGAALRLISVQSGASVRCIVFRGGLSGSQINQVVEVQAGALVATRVVVSDGYYDCVAFMKAKISGCLLELGAGVTISGASNGAIRYDTASTNGQITDAGAALVGGSVLFGVASGGEVTVRAPRASVALNATGLRRTAGSECIAAAAIGTIPAGHPVIADGAKWVSRVDPSLSYT